MKWISVKDRLPNKNQKVLIFLDGYSHRNHIDLVSFIGINGSYYFWDADEYGYEENEVTHWMELPKPPN